MLTYKITIVDGKLQVPDEPTIPFIQGDGTGPDIWGAAVRVIDTAVAKAYNGSRKIRWKEVAAGKSSFEQKGSWLPEEALVAFKDYLVGIKGPLATPEGVDIRSLSVALRQDLDLYASVRPVRWFAGTPSPVKSPEQTKVVVFRENTEDIYAGIEFEEGTEDTEKFKEYLKKQFSPRFSRIRFPDTSGFSIKPVSKEGTQRLVRAAMKHAITYKHDSLTLVHQGNIMKHTEGAFRNWGYALLKEEFGGTETANGPGLLVTAETLKAKGYSNATRDITVNDIFADVFLQQVVRQPTAFSVIAAPNLNGNYIADTLAALTGSVDMAPGASINYETGHAIFEATNGTTPELAGQDKANPGAVILSGVMMLDYMGWQEASGLICSGLEKAISAKRVPYPLQQHMEGATLLKCSEFGDEIIKNMG
ncbi:NADP-dependent isocitrate dehydrogenase [Botryobacter ruber]|uniref:NADP-dependent isocitrate dehydrogenase n=1 Tax=Botryobacter ruber TaxID=2171629 RepID=UPI000E0A9770|nr:NADP-dependent isocitrate dehydrogenase [Botryobacter ruber]